MTAMRKDAGLTLVEALVSLIVFSLLSAGAVTILVQSLRTQDQARHAQAELKNLQITQAFLSADMAQLVDRPMRLDSGAFAPAFVGGGGKGVLARFTRADAGERTAVVRVEYVLRGQDLIRRVERDLDALNDSSPPDERVLMANVRDVRMEFSGGRRWLPAWLSATGASPNSVALVLTSPRYGEIRINALAGSP